MKIQKIIFINLLITSGIGIILFLGYIFYVRKIVVSPPMAYETGYISVDNCKQSPHFKLSLAQAAILGESLKTLEDYCVSRSSLSQNRLKQYWDYHYFSAMEYKSESYGFNDSSDFNSRVTPCSQLENNKNTKQIWIFGYKLMAELA
jgi:hypothetical protein